MKLPEKFFKTCLGIISCFFLLIITMAAQKSAAQLQFEKKFSISDVKNGNIVYRYKGALGLADSAYNIILEPKYHKILFNPNGREIVLFDDVMEGGYNDGGGFLTTSLKGIHIFDLHTKEIKEVFRNYITVLYQNSNNKYGQAVKNKITGKFNCLSYYGKLVFDTEMDLILGINPLGYVYALKEDQNSSEIFVYHIEKGKINGKSKPMVKDEAFNQGNELITLQNQYTTFDENGDGILYNKDGNQINNLVFNKIGHNKDYFVFTGPANSIILNTVSGKVLLETPRSVAHVKDENFIKFDYPDGTFNTFRIENESLVFQQPVLEIFNYTSQFITARIEPQTCAIFSFKKNDFVQKLEGYTSLFLEKVRTNYVSMNVVTAKSVANIDHQGLYNGSLDFFPIPVGNYQVSAEMNYDGKNKEIDLEYFYFKIENGFKTEFLADGTEVKKPLYITNDMPFYHFETVTKKKVTHIEKTDIAPDFLHRIHEFAIDEHPNGYKTQLEIYNKNNPDEILFSCFNCEIKHDVGENIFRVSEMVNCPQKCITIHTCLSTNMKILGGRGKCF